MTPRWPDGVVVRRDEPLARHTARRTGGTCDAWVVVHSAEAVADTFGVVRDLGWRWTLLGAGTRLVVRDGGLAGAVVRLGTGFARIEQDGLRWDVGAAVPLAALVGATVQAGHGGLEGLAGQPGSLGASLVLDDGPGRGWEALVDSVRFLYRGRVQEGSLEEARAPREPVVLGASLRLSLDSAEALRRRARAALAASRTWTWFSGSGRADVRRVLRKSGVAGVRLRAISLPESAPEALVNLGGGTAADFALLERSVTDRVARERGIKLEASVRWTGRHRGGE